MTRAERKREVLILEGIIQNVFIYFCCPINNLIIATAIKA